MGVLGLTLSWKTKQMRSTFVAAVPKFLTDPFLLKSPFWDKQTKTRWHFASAERSSRTWSSTHVIASIQELGPTTANKPLVVDGKILVARRNLSSSRAVKTWKSSSEASFVVMQRDKLPFSPHANNFNLITKTRIFLSNFLYDMENPKLNFSSSFESWGALNWGPFYGIGTVEMRPWESQGTVLENERPY